MPNPNTYIPLDPWVASSLLQKAIRRGATDHALRAAHEFHRHRGSGIWRRLALIAFEDIGIGDLELVQRITMLAADHAYRESFGHERELIEAVVTRMAATPKDRSADYLICTAHDGRDVDAFRDDSRSRPRAERAAIAADAFTSLEKRAVAACTAVEIGYGTKFSAGEPLLELLDAFMHTGLQPSVIETVLVGARLTREPMTLMLLVVASAIRQLGLNTSVTEDEPPRVRLCGDVPTYALDKHTALGKAAISRMVVENRRVSEVISAHVPDFRAVAVAGVAAYYADASPVLRRVDWHQSRPLEYLGLHTDMEKFGCPHDAVQLIANVVREELDHLDDIRCRLIQSKARSPRQGDLLDGQA